MLRTIDDHRDDRGVLVHTQHVRIPMCIQGDKLPTTCAPGQRLWGQVLSDADAIDGVLDASLMCGNPYACEPRVGASVIVTGTAAPARLRSAAKAIATEAWAARHEFDYSPATPGGPLDAMIGKALKDSAARGATTFLSDLGDNLAAGAPGDRTNILGAILKKLSALPPSTGPSDRTGSTLFAGLMDAHAVRRCTEAGIGAEVSLASLGVLDRPTAGTGPAPDEPLGLVVPNVTVVHLADNWQGAVAVVSTTRGGHAVTIVLTVRKWAFFTPLDFESLGLTLADHRIVVLKLGMVGPALMKAAAAPAQNLLVESVGPSSVDIDFTVRPNVVRPIWPLDSGFEYTPE